MKRSVALFCQSSPNLAEFSPTNRNTSVRRRAFEDPTWAASGDTRTASASIGPPSSPQRRFQDRCRMVERSNRVTCDRCSRQIRITRRHPALNAFLGDHGHVPQSVDAAPADEAVLRWEIGGRGRAGFWGTQHPAGGTDTPRSVTQQNQLLQQFHPDRADRQSEEPHRRGGQGGVETGEVRRSGHQSVLRSVFAVCITNPARIMFVYLFTTG